MIGKFVNNMYSASHGILHYLCSVDVSKSFSQLILSIFIFSQYFFTGFYPVEKAFLNRVNIYLFSIFFLIDFAQLKNLGLPNIAYIVIH